MKASFEIRDPGNVEMSMVITMKLNDWIALRKQLDETSYPAWTLRNEIVKLTNMAQEKFCAGGGE